MGEYYDVANLDKKQYIDGNTLDINNTISFTLEPPISSLLVWLIAECACSAVAADRPTAGR